MLRLLACLSLCCFIGCGTSIAKDSSQSTTSHTESSSQHDSQTTILSTSLTTAPANSEQSSSSESTEAQTTASQANNLPPNLGTRKTGTDWERFLGPTGDSVSPEKGIKPWPKVGPKILWTKKFDQGYAIPAISRGRLFHFTREGDKATLTCMKSETAKELWKFEYPTDYQDKYGYSGGPRCCPIVDDDRVHIYGAAGMLHCLKAVDGKLLWKVDTQKDFGFVQNFFGVGSSPIIEENLLIVAVGGSPQGSDQDAFEDLKGNGSAIVAFNKMTGKVEYKLSDQLASYASPVITTINKRRRGFHFARGGLIGFNPTDGKQDFFFPWRAKILESVNASNPLVVDDLVLISETYGPGSACLKIKTDGYDVVWSDAEKGRDKSLQTHWNTPIYDNGYVYGCSGRHTGNAELRCIELKTGKVQWSKGGLGRTSLTKIDGHFLCLGEYGNLHLLKINPKEYDEVSTVTYRQQNANVPPGFNVPPLLKYPSWAAPIVSHGLLYLQGDGLLLCAELIPEKQ